MAENPGLENTHKFYEMDPDERQQHFEKKAAILKRLYSTETTNGMCPVYGKSEF